MSVYSSFLKKVGLIKESVRGTAETTPTKWIAVTPDSEISYGVALLEDPAVHGVMSKYKATAGLLSGSGSIKFPLRTSDIGEFFDMFTDAPTSTEQSAFTVTLATNDKIDFKEDGGSELTATLTAGSYPMGTTSATAGTLCALVKAQLEAVGSGTYTVTYSMTTRKMSIAVSGAVSAVQILWKTGTNGADGNDISSASLLGFTDTADTTSTSPVASDSTTDYPVFTHSFTPATATQPQSYTITFDRSLGVKKYNLCNASEIKISRSPDSFINFEASIMCKAEADGSIGSPSYTTESEDMTFQHDAIEIASSANTQVKNWDISLTNGLFAQKNVGGGQYITDLLATEYNAKGSFTVYFENETERAKFLAGSTTSLTFTLTGDVITGTETHKLILTFDEVQYTAYPYGVEDNLLSAKVTWDSNYSTTNTRVFNVALTNASTEY